MTSLRPDRQPTIYDVAEHARVSKSLVSLVLQGSPKVSETRRLAVLESIETLGYRRSSAAAALAGNRTRTVGVVVEDYRNVWFTDLLDGLQESLNEAGYRIAVSDLQQNSRLDKNPLDGFLSMRAEGIVVATDPTADMMNVHDVPVVMVGTHTRRIPGSDVAANNDRAGGRLATRHLLDLGHRHIGHITTTGGAAIDREAGYDDAMTAARLPAQTAATDVPTEDAAYHATRAYLAAHPDTTALFASNDTAALGVLAAARDAGLRVPADLSVIGYDNSSLAASHLLQLTTVDARSIDVGRAAGLSLVDRLHDAERPPGVALVEPRLVLRKTTASLHVRRG
ncbi:LacI family DNA-binding transcriptional regulator [Spelaeicoccus albus]|uniref:DNA-binding LacI/PurR family transcriptional regulator n=1 Tax=Spelaeicoccus albus TaxID=1280376 RepID=A0A7Z0D0B2_9MICO|nr:LacI family DNA-binding transcriptional regulator [Spelaeicoccus albus]NYI67166.1 DNA-binding LacI/PurR family transcriptional regulator [Spelaeicoccus albus]